MYVLIMGHKRETKLHTKGTTKIKTKYNAKVIPVNRL